MTITQKITPYILALGIGATTLAGCAGFHLDYKPTYQTRTERRIKIREEKQTKKAMNVLHVNDPAQVRTSHEGYKVLRSERGDLRILAGIYAGTVKVRKTKDGYFIRGNYTEAQNPNAMQRVLREADKNKDKIITRQEISDLANRIYPKYAK